MSELMRIEIEGRPLRSLLSYAVDIDLLQLADTMNVTLPADAETWASCPLDAEYRLFCGDTALVSGFIDYRNTRGDTIILQGRDRTGRLVDESLPGAGLRVGDRRLSEVITKIVEPWFTRVEFSNATDRSARRGRGRKVRTASEPADLARRLKAIPRRFDAGTKRAEALRDVLEPHGLIAWAASDGETLIVARPNYDQAPQYRFSDHPERSNVLDLDLAESTRTLYGQIEVSGSGRAGGDLEKNESRNRIGIARSNLLRHPKRLFVAEEVTTQKAAQAMAERLMRQGMASYRTAEVTVAEHGQVRDGHPYPTLYTVDTVATVATYLPASPADDRPVALVEEPMYITRVTYRSDRRSGETTELSLVPLNVDLV